MTGYPNSPTTPCSNSVLNSIIPVSPNINSIHVAPRTSGLPPPLSGAFRRSCPDTLALRFYLEPAILGAPSIYTSYTSQFHPIHGVHRRHAGGGATNLAGAASRWRGDAAISRGFCSGPRNLRKVQLAACDRLTIQIDHASIRPITPIRVWHEDCRRTRVFERQDKTIPCINADPAALATRSSLDSSLRNPG
jgi:hypothetical protein